jgi:hypothetical protein
MVGSAIKWLSFESEHRWGQETTRNGPRGVDLSGRGRPAKQADIVAYQAIDRRGGTPPLRQFDPVSPPHPRGHIRIV